MQARIRGLVRAGVAVVVLAAAGGANAQLIPKEKVRDMFIFFFRGKRGNGAWGHRQVCSGVCGQGKRHGRAGDCGDSGKR